MVVLSLTKYVSLEVHGVERSGKMMMFISKLLAAKTIYIYDEHWANRQFIVTL